MSLRTYRTFQALILGGLGLFMLFKVSDGQILLYINQRFVILVLLGAVGMVILSQVVLRERPAVGDGEESGSADRQALGLWLLALPLLIGLLIPQRPLGASAVQNRGVNVGAGSPGTGAAAATIPDVQRTVLDWVQLAGQDLLVSGEQADVTGFVYHDQRLGAGSFLAGRFTIACCVADAAAYGVVVAWPEAQSLPNNRWVRVTGPVTSMELDGRKVPLIEAETVEIVPEPLQPYLFP